MPGYSGTPLPKTRGIKPGFRVRLMNAPCAVTRVWSGLKFFRRLQDRKNEASQEIKIASESGSEGKQKRLPSVKGSLEKLRAEVASDGAG
jgi:hypothetical protein